MFQQRRVNTFQLTDEQRSLQEAARTYARAKLPAIARECEESGHPPDSALLREFAEMGFLGINVPERYGGLGLGNVEALLVLEEFGKISSAVAFPVFESCVGPVRAIERFASGAVDPRPLVSATVGLEGVAAVLAGERPPGAGLGPKTLVDPRI